MIKIALRKRGQWLTREKNELKKLFIYSGFVFFFFLLSLYYVFDSKQYDGNVRDRIRRTSGSSNALIVKFDSIPDLKIVPVSNDIYFSVKNGDRISLDMQRSETGVNSKYIEVLCVLILVGSLSFYNVLIVSLIIYIFKFFLNYRFIIVSRELIGFRRLIDPLGEETWDDESVE